VSKRKNDPRSPGRSDPAIDWLRARLESEPDLGFDEAARRAEDAGLRLGMVAFLQVQRERAAREDARSADARTTGSSRGSSPSPPARPDVLESGADASPPGDEPADRFQALLESADEDVHELEVTLRPGPPPSALDALSDRIVAAATAAGLDDVEATGNEVATDRSEALLYFEAGDLDRLAAIVDEVLSTQPGTTATVRRLDEDRGPPS
jgi:hypothetical protein